MSAKDINRDLIRARAAEIRESVRKIRHYASVSDETFFADERNRYTLEHLLLIAIEAMATICTHITARTSGAAPASYAECFEALRDADIVDPELAERLIRMARFRNLLVHRYWEIDPTRVLSYAREDLGDLEAFLGDLGAWLEGEAEA